MTMTDVTGVDTTSETHGGFFYFAQFEGLLRIEESAPGLTSKFTDFDASTAGSFLYSKASGISIEVEGTDFACTTDAVTMAAREATIASDLFTASPSDAARAGAFYVEDPGDGASPANYAVTVASTDNTFAECFICQEGGAWTLKDVKDTVAGVAFVESGSSYLRNAAINGGAIKCDGCTISSMTGATFQENSANSGGTILFDNDATATISRTEITDSNSYGDGGAVAAIKTSLEVLD